MAIFRATASYQCGIQASLQIWISLLLTALLCLWVNCFPAVLVSLTRYQFLPQAVFVASVTDLELSQLQPFFDRNWAVFGEGMPPEAVLKLQKMVYLRAVFQLHSSSPPNISLHMPEHLAALIGRLSCTHNSLAFCTVCSSVYTPFCLDSEHVVSKHAWGLFSKAKHVWGCKASVKCNHTSASLAFTTCDENIARVCRVPFAWNYPACCCMRPFVRETYWTTGSVAMPQWSPRMTFLEFLPLAFASLQQQCNFAGDQAMLRQDLLDELAKTKLGPSLETDAVAARSASYDNDQQLVWRLCEKFSLAAESACMP